MRVKLPTCHVPESELLLLIERYSRFFSPVWEKIFGDDGIGATADSRMKECLIDWLSPIKTFLNQDVLERLKVNWVTVAQCSINVEKNAADCCKIDAFYFSY